MVDYFFALNDKIATTRLAKLTANMSDSKVVTAPPPFCKGDFADHH